MNAIGTQGITKFKQQAHEAQQNHTDVNDQTECPTGDIIGDYVTADELLKFIYKVMVENGKRQQLGWIPGGQQTSDGDDLYQSTVLD